jgi:hypothetical protein
MLASMKVRKPWLTDVFGKSSPGSIEAPSRSRTVFAYWKDVSRRIGFLPGLGGRSAQTAAVTSVVGSTLSPGAPMSPTQALAPLCTKSRTTGETPTLAERDTPPQRATSMPGTPLDFAGDPSGSKNTVRQGRAMPPRRLTPPCRTAGSFGVCGWAASQSGREEAIDPPTTCTTHASRGTSVPVVRNGRTIGG